MIRNTTHYLLLLCLLSSTFSFAQHSNSDIQNVARIVMPAVDNAALQAKEKERRKRKQVPEFATKFPVHITPNTHGTWEALPNGKALWRLRIYSKDAYSLNLGFKSYFMPKSGELYIYSPDQSDIKGPFTAADNEEHGQLWTPMVEGNEIVIEVKIDAYEKSMMDLELDDINHDYAGHLLLQNCHIDVACGLADGFDEVEKYRDIIQSVAMYSFNGVNICTGFLVNNARQDCTPYFMTARHCSVSTNNVASMVVYWNFENSTCREITTPENGQRGDGPLDDFNTGASFLADYEDTDMTLIRLDDPVSDKANAFFAGWNRSNDMPSSSICVHHPDTEEKRISIDYDPAFVGTWTTDDEEVEVENGNHLIISDWDIGSTEGGSSGAPLFDQDGFLIGQLHGGLASCTNDEYDSYGWFNKSWEGGGTIDTRLKDWLDPDNLGIERLEGKWNTGCSISLSPETYTTDACEREASQIGLLVGQGLEGELMLSVEGLPESVNTTFSKNPVIAGDSVLLNLSNLADLAGQSTVFEVISEDTIQRYSTLLKLRVFKSGGEGQQVQLQTPLNNEPAVASMPNFVWEADIEGTLYDFQLATDEAFTEIVVESTAQLSNSFVGSTLESNRLYYWRVRSFTPCDGTDWSEVFSFQTGVCAIENARNLPLAISPEDPNDYYSDIEITTDGRISDVNIVGIDGQHSWINDLRFSIISPTGTEVTLIDRICSDEDDFSFSFNDDSEFASLPCPPDDGNSYRPMEPLSAFVGENARGTWRLRIRDNENADGGVLYEWGLQICIADADTDIGIRLSQNEIDLCGEDEIQLDLFNGIGFGDSLMLSVEGLPQGIMPIYEYILAEDKTSISISGLNGIATGEYTITFKLSDGTIENYATLMLYKIPVPNVPNLLEPANRSMEIDTLPMLMWQIQENSTYFIEIARDSTFTDIVESETTDASLYILQETLDSGSTYYWRVTATNSCGMAQSDLFSFITMEVTTSVKEWETSALHVFPNPSSGGIHIDLKEIQERVFTEVITLDAKVLHQQVLAPNQIHTLNLTALPRGVYMLRFVSEEGVLTKRILID